MRKILNINTLNALIRDEHKAYKEYRYMSEDMDTPEHMRKTLNDMSIDELRHAKNLHEFKKHLIEMKRKNK